MASSRLIYLLKPTFYSDVLVMQCSKRVLSSVTLHSSFNSNRRNCGIFENGRSIFPINSQLAAKYPFEVTRQCFRNYATNQKESKPSDVSSISSKTGTLKPESPKLDTSQSKPEEETDDIEQFQKLSLYQRLKAMYRDYWYVLVPVHVSTSIVWLGCFYYAASSGIDIIAILESLHFSESVISVLRDSSAGYFAVAYALYKIFTPVRYTVTLGGTTWAIRFLKERGLIKPRRPMKEAKEKMQEKLAAMKLKREKEKER